MFKTTRFLLFITLTILFIKPCLSDTPQEVSIPGYNPTATSAKPAANVSIKPKEIFPIPKKPVPATDEELRNLIQSVDLSGWINFSGYLWTCTPTRFSIPTYNAKNQLKAAFDVYKKKKKMLTLKMAKKLAAEITKPVDHRIVGLFGAACHFTIDVTNVKTPYTLDCLSILLNARYLSRYAYTVSINSKKEELLDKDTYDAITDLFNKYCTQK